MKKKMYIQPEVEITSCGCGSIIMVSLVIPEEPIGTTDPID